EEIEQHNQLNILRIEPLGELLILDMCYANEHADAMLKGGLQRSQVPMSILMVQLYDSSNQPVFASDVSEETIARIPEVLWDDPNLLIAICSVTEEGPKLGILTDPAKIEQDIVNKVFENKEPAEDQNNEE
ncbi:hypothetical protein ACTHQ2_25260, partial [Bacillus subtilis]|uniref:hypothetical protein n=1 Tax=Bacillus subtilis TaxID=1423 RepID=UPI003F7CBCF7